MLKLLLSLLSLLLLACQSSPQPTAQSAYPSLDPLVAQVAQSRDAQRAAAAQFEAVHEQLLQLPSCNYGDIQAVSAAVVAAHDDAVQAAVAMSTSIDAVQQVADPLFQQWQIEAAVYTDARLKAASQAKLTLAWQNYTRLMQTLRQSAGQADPVLADFNAAVEALQENPECG
ncbi:MAG: DUF2959 family protein [Haliea sp.]|nr:DUF2959 family protein [Haliea sp.]